MAETFVGGSINGGVVKGSSASLGVIAAVLYLLREGVAFPVVGTGDDDPIIPTEQDILWSRLIVVPTPANAEWGIIFSDKIKTMRKMKTGDRIVLSILADGANKGN